MPKEIYGAVCSNGAWRITNNKSLHQKPGIVQKIKDGRLRWLGYIQRMPVIFWKISGKRSHVRSRKRGGRC